MATLPKALTALSALALAAAVFTNFWGSILTSSEGWSRASANLALLAIVLVLGSRSPS